MTRTTDIDCIIVGYNEIPIKTQAKAAKLWAKRSGTYTHVKCNSVLLNGSRMSYMDLLNHTAAAVHGQNPELSAFAAPSLGTCYLKSFLCKRGFVAEIINYFNQEQERFGELLDQSPRAVIITTTYYVDSPPIANVVRFVRQRCPETKIIVGGPYVYNLYTRGKLEGQSALLRNIGADIFVLDSQGESTLALALGALRDESDLETVPNLIYADGDGSFQHTQRRVEKNGLDDNAIDWSYFAASTFQYPIYMRTARSCPFACAFCNYPVVAGEHTLTSLEVLERELRYLHDRGCRHLIFIDDTFNVPLPRFKKLLRMMIANRFEFRWVSFFRCANADEEAFDLMAASGCLGVFLGIESGDSTILGYMNKNAKVERYRHGIKALNKRGISTYSSFIIGFPGETDDTVRNTLQFIEDSQPTFYYLQLYYHDTGTPIHQRSSEFGIESDGYAWKHNSMDWQQATAWIEHMHRTIGGSIHLPETGFSVWGLPYLATRGVSLDAIKQFARVGHEMLIGSFDDVPKDFSVQERKLAALVKEMDLSAAA